MEHKCGGRCGVEDCEKTYKTKHGLTNHLNPKKQCTICFILLSPNYMADHKRRCHPEHAHTIRARLSCPVDDKRAFRFLKQKVHGSLRSDKKRAEKRVKRARERAKKRALGIETIEVAPFLMPDTHARQKITMKIHDRWLKMEGDDAGGFVKPVLEPYNIFSLTYERNYNDGDHFVNNDLENISLVILGINNGAKHKTNNTSLTGTYGKGTVAELKRRRNLTVDLDAIMARESKPHVKKTPAVVYTSCNNVYRVDKKTQAQFGSVGEFFTYCLRLLRKQRARCAISDIPMDGHAWSDANFFQPSLDAIDPTLGHVKNNLRWVVFCLNAADNAKKNKASKKSRWTRQKFLQYIGLSRKRRLGEVYDLYGNTTPSGN